MSTPLSGATAYCTAAQFLNFYDWRPFAQLLSDADSPLPHPAAVQNSGALTAILQAASGTVEMACFVGERYAPADLAALTGNSALKLAKLVADIAAEELWRRRNAPDVPPLPQFKEAAELLQALSQGVAVWGIQEAMQSGLEEDEIETTADIENRRLVTFTARALFGRRNNRILDGPDIC